MNYDPFVKEDFILPEKWCIKSQSRDQDHLVNEFARSCGGRHWNDEDNHAKSNYLNIDNGKYQRGSQTLDKDFTEITFEQFQKYAIKTTEQLKVIETKVESKSIEKWSVGSYVVFLKDFMHINAGYIDVIKETLQNDCVFLEKYLTMAIGRERSGEVKWFATKPEAEEFAKTLVKPVKKEVKQPLKQAVHCKTQEEWDFVSNKIGYKFTTKFELGNSDTINPVSKGCQSKSFFEGHEEYQILSFQEWCDLNGYKMEKEVKFEIGQLVWISSKPMNGNGMDLSGKDDGVYRLMDLDSPEFATGHLLENSHFKFKCGKNYFKTNIKNIRHATPEEINNHLISIEQIPADPICTNTNSSRHDGCGEKYGCIQNCDECNYYQIPAGEPLNTGIEPNKDGMFKYTTYAGTIHVGKCSTVSGPLKMTLSIDDEELPMVNIIKTNSIKQLLNND